MRLLLFTLAILLAACIGIQAQRPDKPRYFMQPATASANAIPYGANVKNGHYVQAGDANIYYEVYGKGKPLVILHGGIVGSTYEMSQFIDSLSKRYQVIAVSTRGHGKSEAGTELPTYERKADDVFAIINTITKGSVIVLGFSDGAYTGYYLAAAHPDKVSKLIAIGAGEWKQGFRTFNNSREVLFSLDSAYFKYQLSITPDPKRYDEVLMNMNTVYSSVNVGKETFSAIRCPVLLMAGELDQNAPLKSVIAAYEMIPRAQLSIIPNAPHPVFIVNFPAVWASMIPFLN